MFTFEKQANIPFSKQHYFVAVVSWGSSLKHRHLELKEPNECPEFSGGYQ